MLPGGCCSPLANSTEEGGKEVAAREPLGQSAQGVGSRVTTRESGICPGLFFDLYWVEPLPGTNAPSQRRVEVISNPPGTNS
jgi:hypothetical protein